MSELLRKNETPELEESDGGGMAKAKYWDEFARKHRLEMRLLFRGGKLWEKEGWRNVVEHSLPQGVAAEVLSEMLQLSKDEEEELIKNAICHDWNKRLEKKPEDFTDEDYEKGLDLIKKIDLNPELLRATEPDFPKQILDADRLKKDIPIIQLLMFYIDNITNSTGAIVSIEDRLMDAQKRHPELNSEHWDTELTAGNVAQNKIYGLLKEKNISIGKPEDLPELVKNIIEKKYSE
jgi:hypothetical protein